MWNLKIGCESADSQGYGLLTGISSGTCSEILCFSSLDSVPVTKASLCETGKRNNLSSSASCLNFKPKSFLFFFYHTVVCTQVPVLPECLHLQLLLCVVGLAPMGERDRLDGTEWNQSASGFYWPGSPLAGSTCKPLRVTVMKKLYLIPVTICSVIHKWLF